MADLSSLKTSITALSEEEAIQLVTLRRVARTTVKVREKGKVSITRLEGMVDTMNVDDLSVLLEALESQKDVRKGIGRDES